MTTTSEATASAAVPNDTDDAPKKGRWLWVLAGLLSTVLGVALGHLVAAWTQPSASPVLAVGSWVIDLTPTPVKEWAIRNFGTADKAILLGTVGLAALVLAVIIGLVARRAVLAGLALLAALGVFIIVVSVTRPAATFVFAVPGAVAAIVGVAALWFLARTLDNAESEHADVDQHSADSSDIARDTEVQRAGASGPQRREFFKIGGAVAVVAAAAGYFGQQIIANAQAVANLVLPKVKEPIKALPKGLEGKISGLSPWTTPNKDFYRVDTALVVPTVDAETWTLEIDGDVESPMTLTFDDLSDFEVIERDITMTCVSNTVGGGYIGSARWLGIRTKDVLEKAGIKGNVDQILSTDIDGMTISTPIDALTDDREALIAFGMNGEPLPRDHGFPVRLITPGLFGFVGSTKWVTKLTATTYAAQTAYWTDRDWAIDAPVLTQARIDTPKAFAKLPAGKETFIGGVAWAQGRGITKVEVSIDEGDWQEVTMGPEANINYWRQWYLPWTPDAGQHQIRVRATDSTGEVQTTDTAPPFPSGSTGQQSLLVNGE